MSFWLPLAVGLAADRARCHCEDRVAGGPFLDGDGIAGRADGDAGGLAFIGGLAG
jgi:hypothetical protein